MKNIIKKLVGAMKLKDKNVVLHSFTPNDNELEIELFKNELEAFDYNVTVVTDSFSELTMLVEDDSMAEGRLKSITECNQLIDLFFMPGPMLPPMMDKSKLDKFKFYLGSIVGSMSKMDSVIQIKMPTLINAEDADLEFDDYKKLLMDAYDIDYKKLQMLCEEKIEELNGMNNVTIESKDGSLLSFDLTGRRWLADDGNGGFPAGEVYIAPVEENTNGDIYFEKIWLDSETRFNDVKITVKNGVIINSSNADFNAFIKDLDDEVVVAELGIGLNDGVKGYVGNPAFDEKLIGTMHIAIGRNDLFGGKSLAPYHIDLVGEFNIKK